MKKVIIIGGTGNGSVIASAMVDANKRGADEWGFVGYLNDREPIGTTIEGYPVLGKLADAKKFITKNYYFINTIYRNDGQQKRIKLFEDLQIPDRLLANFIHPTAYVAPKVKLSAGCVVMPNVSLSSASIFGKCCLIMVNASIGHNCTIGNYCHFAAQSCLGSFVEVANGVHIGLNATIRENVKIGKYSTLGMGAVLLKNIADKEIWIGNPARKLRDAK
ncbi:MAG: NeuD/PglB/VioB family sugar acetyltransferase [Candidatus Cloacimonetes bacterium]|jgi:sugar O-acyltransferase (sialic acid O-acetyltransferase NeuD family)|nr:NeuD/PglB/VioB family sugar acetyltransferase [Candidatus Cloacimonadota bacterium]MBT6993792.1 NeuD/PglB/VioB family sugar acetyltransferase [Candidatus Cloacimonadota bacterium]MBT7470176.1 NeuD/PglB/VioB family sugar acetyltransferase [Candidatus Cloacimonadota bacterium]